MSLIGVRIVATAFAVALAAVPLTAPSAAAASPVCLSGTFQYDYQNAEAGWAKPTVTKPLRGADIALWGAEKSTDSPRQLTPDYQYSAADGGFNLCYTPVTTTVNRLWVRARSEHANLWKVSNSNANLYTLDSPTKTDASGSASVGTVKPAGTANRAWHAFDTVNLLWNARSNTTTGCWTTREADGNACTQLDVRWTSGSTTGPSYDLWNRVYLRDADPDSEHMVLHEAAHFFLHRLYGGWWPKVTNCDPHVIEQASSVTCAWTEGFADSAAAYLLGDSRFVWPNGGSQEYVYGPGWHTGDQVQGNVDASLLDLWRNVDGGWGGTIGALTSSSPSTFADYFKTVRPAANLSTTGAALGYLNSHTINYGPTIVGDGKRHVLTDGGALVMDRGAACGAAGRASVRLAAYSPGSAQQTWWVRAPAADGTVKVFDGCPDSLALTAPYTAGGQVTVLAVNSSNAYQDWRVAHNGGGTYTLTNPATGYVLDSAAINAGAAVTAGPASTANSQGWAAIT